MKDSHAIEQIKQFKHKKSLLVSNAINELNREIAGVEEEICQLRNYLHQLREEQVNYKKEFYINLTKLEKFSGNVFVELDLELEKYTWKIDQKIESINSTEEQLSELQHKQQLLKNQYLALMRKVEKYNYLQESLAEVGEC